MSETSQKQSEQALPPIQLHNQFIKDLSLEIPHAPEIFKNVQSQPAIKIDVDISARPLENGIYTVELNFRIDGDIEDKKFFIVEMSYCGVVELHVPEEHVQPVLMVEIPHMLFPFARQAINNVMFNGGLPPLMLNPIDFVAMYKAKVQNTAANQN